VSQSEARKFIDSYNATYTGIKAFMDRTREEVKQRGYVTTLLNRRRYIPDVNSPIPSVKQEALRQAINMPVQGTAADMIKLAMIRLFAQLPAAGLHGEMILQVHDELLLRVPEAELPETAALVKETMVHALPLEVPVRVDVEWGRDWYTLSKLE
jgi:DNA polymerase-1